MKKSITILLLTAMLATTFSFSPSFSIAKTEEELKRELAEIERQIAQQEQELGAIQGEKQTLANKLTELKKQQTALKLQIQATNLRVSSISNQINETENSIKTTEERIADAKVQLAEALRTLNEQERRSLVEVIVGAESLSDALVEVQNLNQLSDSLIQLTQSMYALKDDLAQKQEVLEDQHAESRNLLAIQILQGSKFSAKVNEQDAILEETEGREEEYQRILKDSRARAGEIRVRLYDLAGGGPQTNVTFGEAVEIARVVSAQTGVRAALLLAVLTQESNLGKNVGTCNRAGDPPEKSWRAIMHPTRDAPLFTPITQELGMDTDTTPVSCPMFRGDRQIGWGGAMGPAQFIPSTWVGYKDKVSAITGRPANPWDIRDAFTAAGVLLATNGATVEGETGEWKAAMRYFSGGLNPAFRFYGDNVLALARRYQAEMDALGGN